MIKTIHTNNSLLRSIYNMLRNDVTNNLTCNGNNWVHNVKTMFDNLVLSFIWDNQDTFENIPYLEIKQRIFDNANQELIMSINTSTKLQTYSSFKYDTEYEPYLKYINNKKHKFALSRLRLSAHSLAVESGHMIEPPRDDRLCAHSNIYQIENEYHFILVCPPYDLHRYTSKIFSTILL